MTHLTPFLAVLLLAIVSFYRWWFAGAWEEREWADGAYYDPVDNGRK